MLLCLKDKLHMRHVGAYVPALHTMNFVELRVDERNLSDSKVANLNLALGIKRKYLLEMEYLLIFFM